MNTLLEHLETDKRSFRLGLSQVGRLSVMIACSPAVMYAATITSTKLPGASASKSTRYRVVLASSLCCAEELSAVEWFSGVGRKENVLEP